jgi:hypothetical protein
MLSLLMKSLSPFAAACLHAGTDTHQQHQQATHHARAPHVRSRKVIVIVGIVGIVGVRRPGGPCRPYGRGRPSRHIMSTMPALVTNIVPHEFVRHTHAFSLPPRTRALFLYLSHTHTLTLFFLSFLTLCPIPSGDTCARPCPLTCSPCESS